MFDNDDIPVGRILSRREILTAVKAADLVAPAGHHRPVHRGRAASTVIQSAVNRYQRLGYAC